MIDTLHAEAVYHLVEELPSAASSSHKGEDLSPLIQGDHRMHETCETDRGDAIIGIVLCQGQNRFSDCPPQSLSSRSRIDAGSMVRAGNTIHASAHEVEQGGLGDGCPHIDHQNSGLSYCRRQNPQRVNKDRPILGILRLGPADKVTGF